MTKVRLSNEGKQDKQDLERFRIYEFDMCIVKIPMLKSQNQRYVVWETAVQKLSVHKRCSKWRTFWTHSATYTKGKRKGVEKAGEGQKEREAKEETKERGRIRTFSSKRKAWELLAVSEWSQEERIHETFSKSEAQLGKNVAKKQVLLKLPRVGLSCKHMTKENCTFRIKFQNFKEILRKYQNWLPSQHIQTL